MKPSRNIKGELPTPKCHGARSGTALAPSARSAGPVLDAVAPRQGWQTAGFSRAAVASTLLLLQTFDVHDQRIDGLFQKVEFV